MLAVRDGVARSGGGPSERQPGKIVRAVFFACGALLACLAAWLFYDSWLRPLRVVATWAALTILLSGLAAFCRITAAFGNAIHVAINGQNPARSLQQAS